MTAYEAFSLLLMGPEDWTQVMGSVKLTFSVILLALDRDLNASHAVYLRATLDISAVPVKPKDSIISSFFLMFMKFLLLTSSVIWTFGKDICNFIQCMFVEY